MSIGSMNGIGIACIAGKASIASSRVGCAMSGRKAL